MSRNNSSQCQLFQLHIDAYLDDELEAAREADLERHLANCSACSSELAYARKLHLAIANLPILDCSDQALEPVDRLFTSSPSSGERTRMSLLDRLTAWMGEWPMAVRYAIPTVVVALGLGIGMDMLREDPGPEIVQDSLDPGSQETAEYSDAEIVRALQDLQLAIDYLGEISQRTNVMIEDRFLLQQLEDSINASFRDDSAVEEENNTVPGPI